MKAMYVYQTKYIRYAEAIVLGLKPIETRNRNMLSALVGERVAVIRTMAGKKAMVVGYVTVTSAIRLGAKQLDANRDKTLIPPGSRFDCTGSGKWCYFLADAEICEPYEVPSSAVKHGRSWCEFEIPGPGADCTGECDSCPHKKRVPGDIDRIDREPRYFCDYELKGETK